MVSGFFVGGFVEFANELFEAAAHFEIGDNVGVEVDFGEFLDEFEQAVGFIEFLDLLVEGEVTKEGAGFGREGLDIVKQVLGQTFGIGQEFGEIVLAGVVELLPGGAAEHFIDDGRVLALAFLVLFEDLGFGGFENAIEAAEDGHGEHDFAIFGRAVGAAKKVGNVPNETDEVVGVISQGRGILCLGKRINDEFRSYQRVRPGSYQ